MTTSQTIDGVPSKCRVCGSTSLSWFAQNTVPNGIQQNRLNTHDVQCVFVLGCDHCSETLKIISADKIADHFNKPAAQPQPQPQDEPEAIAQGFGVLTFMRDEKAHAGCACCPGGDHVFCRYFKGLPDFNDLTQNLRFRSDLEGRQFRVIVELITDQPAPLAVVLPERKHVPDFTLHPLLNKEYTGWNACIDEVICLKSIDPRTPFEIEKNAEPGDEAAFRKWLSERPTK